MYSKLWLLSSNPQFEFQVPYVLYLTRAFGAVSGGHTMAIEKENHGI